MPLAKCIPGGERKEAERAAWSAVGVVEVEDELVIARSRLPTPEMCNELVSSCEPVTANTDRPAYDPKSKGETAMTIDGRFKEAYTGLCKLLRYPQEFGLGQTVPQPLANLMEKTLGTLDQIMQEKEQTPPDGDLEVELSQDADLPCHIGG